jgi:hypothetical protein
VFLLHEDIFHISGLALGVSPVHRHLRRTVICCGGESRRGFHQPFGHQGLPQPGPCGGAPGGKRLAFLGPLL